MGNYSMVTDKNGNVSGLWICDPQMSQRSSFLCMLLQKENVSKELQMQVMAGKYRVVPNTFDDSGGCFIMFGSELAAGENPIDVAEKTVSQKSKSSGIASLITKVHLFVEIPWIDESIDPADVKCDVPFEFIEFADQELQLNGELSSYVQEVMDSIKVTNLKRLNDDEKQTFYSNQSKSQKWETYFRSTEAGYRYSILVEYNLDEWAKRHKKWWQLWK